MKNSLQKEESWTDYQGPVSQFERWGFVHCIPKFCDWELENKAKKYLEDFLGETTLGTHT
jgi:hypothetical protein